MIRINVAKDFYIAPVGRVPADGDYNGERFRKEYLVPALQKADIVFIDLDGSEGYGSSFLEEAFGGLVRKEGFTAEDLKRRLDFKSDDDSSYLIEIEEYISDATRAEGAK